MFVDLSLIPPCLGDDDTYLFRYNSEEELHPCSTRVGISVALFQHG